MTQITSLYAHKVVSQASAGVETHDLLESLGIDPNGPVDPSRMIAAAAYYDFFAKLVDRDPNGLILPFRIGASMQTHEYGAFGLAWKSAPNLRGSFSRAERYGKVLGSAETYSLEDTDGGLFFSLEKAGDGRAGMILSNEASLAAVDAICRQVTTAQFKPLGIYFKHAPRGDAAVYERHFDCPVFFETGRDAISMRQEDIEAPNRIGDETIASFFDRHLEEELAIIGREQELEHQIRSLIAQELSEGIPTLSHIASKLGIGARTMQRRLQEKGVSFQTVVDMARKDLASRLLRETHYELAEIAFLTGFSEQSAFTRAFKRWAGQTPRSYRLAVSPA